jgi:hypothetical protein
MDEAPGWAAIDAALERIYGTTEPLHWATLHKWALGGPDPLDGISVHPRADPVPHWHFVGYGMSELYEKESDNPDESGWGFEFTFRLARASGAAEPPVWAANFLQNLARYVFNSGNWFEPGHTMKANGPIAADRPDSEIQAIIFVLDPELGEISTPHGRLQFLQVVGVTLDEYEAARQWNSRDLIELLTPRMPLCVTDLDRGSLLTDPATAAAVREGVERDGPSGDTLLVTVADWSLDDDGATLRFGALAAANIARELAARLPRGRGLLVRGDDRVVDFAVGERFEVERVADTVLQVRVPPAAADDVITALRPEVGRHPVASLPGLVIEIERSVIRDGHGNETGEVIG